MTRLARASRLGSRRRLRRRHRIDLGRAQQSPKAVKGELIVGFAEGVSRARAERDPERRRRDLEEALRPDRRRPREGEGRRGGVRRQGPLRAIRGWPTHSRTTSSRSPRHRTTRRSASSGACTTPGQTGGTNDKDIDAPEAWELATGDSNIVVAVTDTGVDFSHPDLDRPTLGEHARPGRRGRRRRQRPRRRLERVGLRERRQRPVRRQPARDACLGHDRRRGEQRRRRRRRQLEREDHGAEVPELAGSGTTADAIASTLYAADHGADVSSNSWGGGPYEQALLDAIEYGASRGMLFVAAAGNDGFNNDVTPTYPATYASDAVLAVAATDHNDGLAVLLELRRQVRRSRSPRRRHPLDDARQRLRVLRRDLDGHAARRGSGRSRRGQVPGSDALRDQGAAHELGGSRRLARREDGDRRPAQHRQRTRLRQPGESRAERPRQRLRRGRERRHPDQGPGRELRSSGRNRERHSNRQRNARGACRRRVPDTGLYTGSYAVNGPGALSVTATRDGRGLHRQRDGERQRVSELHLPGRAVLVGRRHGGSRRSPARTATTRSRLSTSPSRSRSSDRPTRTAFVSSNGFLALGSSAERRRS